MKNKLLLRVCLLCSLSVVMKAQSSRNLSPRELEVFNQHKVEINTYAKISAEDKLLDLRSKYSIPLSCQTTIKTILLEQEGRMSICNFMYPDSTLLRYKEKQKIRKSYDNSITRNLLLAGANATTENYSLALKMKQALNLSTTQIDTIIEKSIEINGYYQRHPNMDKWAHELKTFNKTLSTEQLDRFLSLKNERLIKRNVKNTWNKLKENNLTADLDSTKVANELYIHYFKEQKAADLYSKNDSLKREVLKAINDIKPLAIQRLNTIKKGKQTQQSYKGNYIW